MTKQHKPEPDYIKIGKSVASLQDVFVDKKLLYKTAFIKGIFGGLGSVIGATIVVAILLWTLSLFQQIPFVGQLSETVRQTIDTKE